MKKFLLLLIFNSQFLIINSFAQTPGWIWATSMGELGSESGYSIAIDPANGDIYTTGWFQTIVDFDPGPGAFNLTAIGVDDIFISKYDSSGNFIWAKQIGGNNSYCFGYSIAIDKGGSGDIYTTGIFDGTVDFDPGAGVFNLTATGLSDIYISKFDNSGNFVWTKQVGGLDYCSGNSIAIDLAGSRDVYATGFFGGTVDFDPGTGIFNLTSGGQFDFYIVKLDSSGNFVWAKQMGGNDIEEGVSIALDPVVNGAIYTTGYFDGTADFDPGPGVFNLTAVGGYDNFISKLDNSGNFVWAKSMTGAGLYDFSRSLAIDPANGGIYTIGYFVDSTDFDPGTGIYNLTSAGTEDIFISKLDSSGNFVWAKKMGGTNYDEGSSIAIDPAGSGSIYTSGHFRGTADFDPGAGVFNLTSAGYFDIFISKLDSLGNFVWAKSVGESSDDYSHSIALDAAGPLYISGSFDSPTISFGTTTLVNADPTGASGDIFIAKLNRGPTGINELENYGISFSIFPNPFTNSTTISFALTKSQQVSLKIFDVSGRLVSILANKKFDAGENKLVWNAANVNAGIYFLQIETANYSGNQKLIVTK